MNYIIDDDVILTNHCNSLFVHCIRVDPIIGLPRKIAIASDFGSIFQDCSNPW